MIDSYYRWAPQAQSPDIAHLPKLSKNFFNGKESFFVDIKTLIKISKLHHFPLHHLRNDKILFGIRASKFMGEYAKWCSKGHFSFDQPDHETLHCTLGIWDMTNHTLAFFPASTLPSAYWMQQQQKTRSPVANMLVQGLHSYYIGSHEPLEKPAQMGAFCLNRNIEVGHWRLYEGNAYSLDCFLDSGCPNDNIHASHYTGGERLDYSSAGCQTIHGNHDAPKLPTSYYQLFREMAGQSRIPDPNQIGLPFHYLLIHSAHLFAITKLNFNEPRLMQGSVSALVNDVQNYLVQQQFLKSEHFNKGYYQGQTVKAVYAFQKHHHLLADGIIKSQDLQCMKLEKAYD